MTFPIADCAFMGDVGGNGPTETKQMMLPIGRGDVFTVQSILRLKADGHGQWGGGFKKTQLEMKSFITFHNTYFSHKLSGTVNPQEFVRITTVFVTWPCSLALFPAPLHYIITSRMDKKTATEWCRASWWTHIISSMHEKRVLLRAHHAFSLSVERKCCKFCKQWAHLPPTPPSPTSCLSPIQPTNFQHFQICRLCNHADDLANSDHRFDQSPGAKRGFRTSAVPAPAFWLYLNKKQPHT